MSGHIVDLYWSLLLNVAPFCKHAKRGRGGLQLFSQKGDFFHKKMLFLNNIECCAKFIEYALHVLKILYNF